VNISSIWVAATKNLHTPDPKKKKLIKKRKQNKKLAKENLETNLDPASDQNTESDTKLTTLECIPISF
jgi:hypothetical protein